MAEGTGDCLRVLLSSTTLINLRARCSLYDENALAPYSAKTSMLNANLLNVGADDFAERALMYEGESM
eukprot:10880959-Heterocapsa_arctica.AAC.2